MSFSSPKSVGLCPVCNGTWQIPIDKFGRSPDETRPYVTWPQYIARGWMPCRNCGGQTMSGMATGQTTKRHPDDEMGCRHEYEGRNAGRCYTIYTCKHCGNYFDIDSGD